MKSNPARKVTTGYYPGFMLPPRIRVNPRLALCPALDQAFRCCSGKLRKGTSNRTQRFFNTVFVCTPKRSFSTQLVDFTRFTVDSDFSPFELKGS